MSDNKKIGLLLALCVIVVAAGFVTRMPARQRRALTPYLAASAAAGVGVLAAGATLVLAARRRARQRQIDAIQQAVAAGETWLLLRPKEARPVDVEKVTLWKRLAYAQPTGEHFSFEVFGNSERQQIAVHASKTKSRAILREFLQEWPDVQRRAAGGEAGQPDPAETPEGWAVYWLEIGPSSAEKPITVSSRDPLLAALSEISDIPGPTRALLQVIARSDTSTRRQLGLKSAAMRSGPVQDPGVKYQRGKEAKLLEERGARLFLETVVRVSACSPDPERARGAAIALANTLCNQFGPDNPMVILAQADGKKRRNVNPAARSMDGAFRSWADDELAAIAHLPGGDALKLAPLLSTGSAKFLPARPEMYIPKGAHVSNFEEKI